MGQSDMSSLVRAITDGPWHKKVKDWASRAFRGSPPIKRSTVHSRLLEVLNDSLFPLEDFELPDGGLSDFLRVLEKHIQGGKAWTNSTEAIYTSSLMSRHHLVRATRLHLVQYRLTHP